MYTDDTRTECENCKPLEEARKQAEFWEERTSRTGQLYASMENQRDDVREKLGVAQAEIDRLTAENTRLQKRSDFLAALEETGVDNWDGWDDACQIAPPA